MVFNRARFFGPVSLSREARIEHRREDLLDGMMDQAIKHVWDAELSLTATRLVNGLPPHSCGLVGAIEKLLSKLPFFLYSFR